MTRIFHASCSNLTPKHPSQQQFNKVHFTVENFDSNLTNDDANEHSPTKAKQIRD